MNKWKYITCIIFNVVFLSTGYCQLGFELAGGVQHLALGRSAVTLKGPSSIFGNQAAMVYTQKLEISANAARRYNVSGLDLLSFGLIYNSDYGHIGLGIQQYGYAGYKEQKIGVAYARKITAGTSISIQMDLLNISVLDFGSKAFYTVEFGIYTELSQSIHLGAHVFSPAGIAIDEDYDIPSRIRIGPKFLISEELTAYLEFEKIIDLDPALKAGISYDIHRGFSIMAGVVPSQSEFSFGFKYTFNKTMQLGGSYLYDQRLGATPGVGISYSKQ